MDNLHSLCEKLIKTYNTTIIDKMPYVLQEALYNDASSCSTGSYKQNEKDRTVLTELIKNHFTKKTQREELSQHYIGGPMTLTCHWSETYQKLIYIFGEEHADHTDCSNFLENYGYGKNEEQSGMHIKTYLKKLTEINDIFLDIFIEIPAYKQKTLKYSTSDFLADVGERTLWKIGAEFSECMEEVNELNQTKCSRSRIHYIDVRNVEWQEGYLNELDPLSNFINICYHTINSSSELNQKKDDLSNIVKSDYGKYIMNGFLLSKNSPEYLNFWYGMMLKNSYVKKELDNCDKEMVKKIYDFYKKELIQELDTDSIIEGVDGITKTVNNLQSIKEITDIIVYYTYNGNIDPNIFIVQFNELRKFLIPINAAVVDCYTLCRIFKKFNLQPDNQQKRRSTDEPESPTNIIIYAGNNHSNRYRKFLKENYFSLIADIGSTKLPVRNCINMTEHDTKQPGAESGWSLQPLFSAWPPPTQPSFSALPPLEQKSFFGVFGAQQSLLASPQQSILFGGFDLPLAPKKELSKQEKEAQERLLDKKKLYEEDTEYGNVGKSNTKADHKKSARRKGPYG